MSVFWNAWFHFTPQNVHWHIKLESKCEQNCDRNQNISSLCKSVGFEFFDEIELFFLRLFSIYGALSYLDFTYAFPSGKFNVMLALTASS